MEGKLSLWTLTLVGAWKVNAATWTLALGSTRAGKPIFLHFASNAGVRVSLGILALGHMCAGEGIILDFGAGGSVEGEGIALDFGAGEASPGKGKAFFFNKEHYFSFIKKIALPLPGHGFEC